VRHTTLRELAFEGVELPPGVARAVGESDLPSLEHLDLWLGRPDEASESLTVEDLAEILSGARLPSLRYLGLINTWHADEVAAAVATAPVVARLTELDLSQGTIGDAGAEALLAGQPLRHLRRLNLSHPFMSDDLVQRLKAELPGVDVDTSAAQEIDPNEPSRWLAVAE
jgi:hypothetical protein